MTTSLEAITEALRESAVAIFKGEFDTAELSKALSTLARRTLTVSGPDFLGEPNSLTPKNWLSYGRASYELPLHTDYPDYSLPPRFVLLTCHSVGSMPVETVFYDVGKTALEHPSLHVLLTEPWLTTGGVEKSRVVRLLELDGGGRAPLLRYASNVMRPFFRASSMGAKVLASMVSTTQAVAIVLLPSETVIWDNWRVLHGRQAARKSPGGWAPGRERVLERLKWI